VSNARQLVPMMTMLLAASACFSVPVGGPPADVALDAALVGEWNCKPPFDSKHGDHGLLSVMRFDGQQYYVEWTEGDKRERYRAYPVRLEGVTVVNVGGELTSPRWHWLPFRYSFPDQGKLVIQFPAERIFDMSDEEAAIRELTAKADRSDTWQAFARCEASKDGA
jgi:hypothetical protein